jgi:hypothetical protein
MRDDRIEELETENAVLKAEGEGLKKVNSELENQIVEVQAIYEAISDILRDGYTSDFMMSFPLVSKIADLRERACCLSLNEWGHTNDCMRYERDRLKTTLETFADYILEECDEWPLARDAARNAKQALRGGEGA